MSASSYGSLLQSSSDSSSHGLLASDGTASARGCSDADSKDDDETTFASSTYIPAFSFCSFSYSSMFFTWVNPLIKKGKDITSSDMLDLPPNFSSARVYKKMISCWAFEELKIKVNSEGIGKKNDEKPKLWRVLHSLIFWEFWLSGFFRLISDISVVLGTILIKQIIASAQNRDKNKTMYLALLMMLNSILQSLMLQQFIHGSFNCGSRVVSATTSAVYHAVLSLRLHKIDPPRSLGEINNIQSKDSSSLREFVVFFHNLWSCPLMILACVFLLIYLLGLAGLVCFILICLLLPLQSYISKKAKVTRKSVLTKSDERMKLINELIDGIWTVKLTGLCPFIYEKVCKIRSEELAIAWKSQMIEVINTVITRSGTLLITLITFSVYFAIEGSRSNLKADNAFAALSLISIIGRPIQVIPKCISVASDAMVSMDRIEGLLNEGRKSNCRLLEHSSSTIDDNDDQWIEFESPDRIDIEDKVHAISSSNINVDNITSIRQPNSVKILENLSLSLRGPGLVVITGTNGSAKTTLLLTMLNELTITKGRAFIFPQSHRVAYCGHDSWIMNATVKENILLGSRSRLYNSTNLGAFRPDKNNALDSEPPFDEIVDEEFYKSVIERSALIDDLNSWVNGDGTLIGEKGINISGGQKQRLAFARALYSKAQVLMLDSILSGLDVTSSNHVFHQGILPASQDRLILLASHQKDILQYASQIVVMDAGKIVAFGSYSDLVNSGLAVGDSLQSICCISRATDSRKKTKKYVGNDIAKAKGAKFDDEGKDTFRKKKESANGDTISNSSDWQVYKKYFQAGGYLTLIVSILLSLSAYSVGALADYQLAKWTDGEYTAVQYLAVYASLSLVTVLLNYCRYYMQALFGFSASTTLHRRLLESILGARFSFFHETPSGRIISRFSIDFDTIDFSLPQNITSFCDSALGILTGVGVVVLASPYYLLVVIPLTWKYLKIQKQYRPVSKALKVLDSAAKGPLFSFFRETVSGLDVIRGYKIESKLLTQYHRLLDQSIRTRLNWDAANRWLGLRLDLIGALIVSAAAFSLLLMSNGSKGGTVGLVLIYAVKATNSLSFAIRSSTALENMFTSAERVSDYINLEQEILTDKKGSTLLLHDKLNSKSNNVEVDPNNNSSYDNNMSGDVEICISPLSKSNNSSSSSSALSGNKITVRYKPSLTPCLKNLSFQLNRGRVVGVCGRSGCGKSSLSMLIAQAFQDIEGGILSIDGRNVRDLTLAEYRTRIAIYPQDSFIFSGKMRSYLDPESQYSDTEINNLLLELTKAIESTGGSELSDEALLSSSFSLDKDVSSGGSNLSAGEKQIAVFARATLSSATHVVVLDEITSNMDRTAAARSMHVLKSRLVNSKNLAVMLIAHNLDDIMCCDDVWVMKNGEIIESGSTQELISNPKFTVFQDMWRMHITGHVVD